MSAQAGLMIATDVPERVREALLLRAQGLSWRKVADAVGHANHSLLYHECRSHDAAMKGDERWAALSGQAIEIAQEAGAQTMQALLANEIPKTQLPIVYGIAVDKVVNMRRAEQGAKASDAGLVAGVLERLQAGGGGSVELRIEVAGAAIDVTPSK